MHTNTTRSAAAGTSYRADSLLLTLTVHAEL